MRVDAAAGRGVRLELPAVLTQVLRKDPVSIEASLGELHLNKVCARRGNRVEICDRFWPYQKVGTGPADPEADFVRLVREAFLKPACVRSAFTAADEKLVLNLCRRGVGSEQVRRAIWLGCARKYVAMLNGQTRLPITSLAYFASLIEELDEPQIPAGAECPSGHRRRTARPATGAEGVL